MKKELLLTILMTVLRIAYAFTSMNAVYPIECAISFTIFISDLSEDQN